MMTLVAIIQEAAGALGQPVPTAIFGSTVGDAVQWRNLAQREGRELARRHDWQGLCVEQTWTTTATEAQASALPSAYDHLPPDVQVWNRTNSVPLIGPIAQNDWMILNSSSASGGSVGWWRIIG